MGGGRIADKRIKRYRTCINCKRELEYRHIVRHHLIPAQILRKENLINKLRGNTILLCKPCEFILHYIYNNKELEKNLNTKEKILSDERMKIFAEWIYDKPYTKKNTILLWIRRG